MAIFWIAVTGSAAGQTNGRDLYIAKCSACHAPDGSGTGTIGRSLKLGDIRPAVKTSTDEQLRQLVAEGRGRMPGSKKFNDEQIRNLTLFLRDLADGNPKAGRAFAEEQSRPLADVRETFRDKCSACHGQDGAGRTTIGRSEAVPDLAAAVRRTDEELRNIIAVGEGRMPGYQKVFNLAQISQLVSYIHQLHTTPVRSDQAKVREPALQVYVAKCAACHSLDGSGTGTIGRSLGIASLTSPQIQARSDEELAAAISQGGGKMPVYYKKFSVQQIHQLVGYIRDLARKQ